MKLEEAFIWDISQEFTQSYSVSDDGLTATKSEGDQTIYILRAKSPVPTDIHTDGNHHHHSKPSHDNYLAHLNTQPSHYAHHWTLRIDKLGIANSSNGIDGIGLLNGDFDGAACFMGGSKGAVFVSPFGHVYVDANHAAHPFSPFVAGTIIKLSLNPQNKTVMFEVDGKKHVVYWPKMGTSVHVGLCFNHVGWTVSYVPSQ